MKVVVYGASGMIGQRVVTELLQRGHTVTGAARNPEKIDPQAGLTPMHADASDLSTLIQTAEGHDAVISAIGPDFQNPDTFQAQTDNLIQAFTQTHIPQVLVVGGAGGLEVAPGVRVIDTPEFPDAWKGISRQHILALPKYKASDLNWTFVCPAIVIEPGERTGSYRVGGDQVVFDDAGQSYISAEDFAIALVDELENPRYSKQRITIAK